MPGALVHLTTGFIMFFIGKYYFRNYFQGEKKTKEKILLLLTCIFFSSIADIVLIIYYTTYILPYCTLLPYHNLIHLFLFPITITTLFIITYIVETKRKPIWIMGMWCLLLHLLMDLIIPDSTIPNIWI